VKWFLAGVLAAVLLGPGVLALRRGDPARPRPWLGKGAAIALAAVWVLALVAIALAL
jgi:hypothetical protein